MVYLHITNLSFVDALDMSYIGTKCVYKKRTPCLVCHFYLFIYFQFWGNARRRTRRPPASRIHPHSRYRRGGHHHPAQHLLPDGRQLLVRRLFQARRHRTGLGTADKQRRRRGIRTGSGTIVGHRVPRRRRGRAAVARHRRLADGADPAPRHGRQLLVDGHPGAMRSVVGDLLRPGAKVRARGGRIANEDRYLEDRNLVFMQNERGEDRTRRTTRSSGRCPARTSTPAWVWSASRWCCRACTTSTRPTCCGRSSTSSRPGRRGYDVGNHEDDVRYRIIADHSRTAAILIADGVSPGNDGRGYVLRRLLRRVIRSAKLLGIDTPIVGDLMATVRDAMGPSYPELVSDFARINRIAVAEETAFNRTVESGSQLFDKAAVAAKASGHGQLTAEVAFTLHDTYGFPIELTLETAAEAGLSVDATASTN